MLAHNDPQALRALFKPSSVAVVGASDQRGKWGNVIVENILGGGYVGELYLVNARGSTVYGRETVRSIRDVQGPVDLVIVGVAASAVPSVVEECAAAGCRIALIVTSGFGEASSEGASEQERMVRTAQASGMRIVGPNCLGIYTSPVALYASVGLGATVPGGVALASQSGNVGIGLFRQGARAGIGFHSFIGVGNQADVGFDEYFRYLAQDSACRVVASYIEGVPDGEAFLAAVEECASVKPVVALKGGRTATGATAARSHTGSMATDGRTFEGLFEQAGGLVVDTLDELVVATQLFDAYPEATVGNVAILTDGGGFGVLATDACERMSLPMARVSLDTEVRLRSQLPDYCSVRNPVDVGGAADADPRVFVRSAQALLADPEVDALLISGIIGGYASTFSDAVLEAEMEAIHGLSALAESSRKPIVIHSLWSAEDSAGMNALRRSAVPVVGELRAAVNGLALLRSRSANHSSSGLRCNSDAALPPHAIGAGEIPHFAPDVPWDEAAIYGELQRCGVQVPAHASVNSEVEAVEAARAIGYPVVMKVMNPTLAHKSDIAGVVLHVASDAAVRDQYGRLAALGGRVLVAQQISGVVEVLVGTTKVEAFGPVVSVGSGGLLTEAINDATFLHVPATPQQLDTALRRNSSLDRSLRTARRGNKLARGAVIELAHLASRTMQENPQLQELEMNPVVVDEVGAWVVDAKVQFKR